MKTITTLTCANCGDIRSGSCSHNETPKGWSSISHNQKDCNAKILLCNKPGCIAVIGQFAIGAQKPPAGYIAGKTEQILICMLCQKKLRITTAPVTHISIGGFPLGGWMAVSRNRQSFLSHDTAGMICPECAESKFKPIFPLSAHWFLDGEYPDILSPFRED